MWRGAKEEKAEPKLLLSADSVRTEPTSKANQRLSFSSIEQSTPARRRVSGGEPHQKLSDYQAISFGAIEATRNIPKIAANSGHRQEVRHDLGPRVTGMKLIKRKQALDPPG